MSSGVGAIHNSTLRAAKNHCDRQKKADAEDNLLADIRDAFDANPALSFIGSKDLIRLLCADEFKKWATFNNGNFIGSRQIAKLLEPHHIYPKRNKEQTARGYYRADFESAWACYTHTPELSVYPSINDVEPVPMRVTEQTDKNIYPSTPVYPSSHLSILN